MGPKQELDGHAIYARRGTCKSPAKRTTRIKRTAVDVAGNCKKFMYVGIRQRTLCGPHSLPSPGRYVITALFPLIYEALPSRMPSPLFVTDPLALWAVVRYPSSSRGSCHRPPATGHRKHDSVMRVEGRCQAVDRMFLAY